MPPSLFICRIGRGHYSELFRRSQYPKNGRAKEVANCFMKP
nr:MAG TPA: hypothetical protein [Bacteriophage sp.]